MQRIIKKYILRKQGYWRVGSRKMNNKINLKDLCILIMVLERFGGNSFLGTHNMYTSCSSWAVRLRAKGLPFLLFSLGMSTVLGSFCQASFFARLLPSFRYPGEAMSLSSWLQLTCVHASLAFPSLSPACLMAKWHLLPGEAEVLHRESVALLGGMTGSGTTPVTTRATSCLRA